MISFRWKVWVAALCFIAFTVNGLHIASIEPERLQAGEVSYASERQDTPARQVED